MAEPTVIGSGQPHTVSLPEGSTVATRRRLRKAGGQLPEQPGEARREGSVPGVLPVRGKAKARGGAGPDEARAIPARAAAPVVPIGPRALDPALLARIAELTQRNQAVRATLDHLPGEDPATS